MTVRNDLIDLALAPAETAVRFLTNEGPWFLTYHGVGDTHANISLSPSRLREHVGWLNDSQFVPMTLGEFLADGQPEHAVVMTFDDGTLGQYESAAAILEEFGMSGVFYLVVDYIGREGYLSWNQARQLAEKHEIGAHTWSHPDLGEDDTGVDLEREILDARSELERRLSTEVSHFAIPYGKYHNVSTDMRNPLQAANYTSVATTTGYLPGQYTELWANTWLVKRLPINTLDLAALREVVDRRSLVRRRLRDGFSEGGSVRDVLTGSPHDRI